MSDAHFISYSSADALDFALKLADALSSGPPAFPVWIDKRRLEAGQDWDVQLREAIRSCASLIFVLSRDSVEDLSVCKEEWSRALSYKKPVTPILYHARIEKPFGLGARQHIDFTGDFERGLAQLRTHLQRLASPAGQLDLLKLRLADAMRDQRRSNDAHELQRIADEIALLRQQIAAQAYALANPQAAAQAVQTRIETGLERERHPERPVTGEQRTKFINPPPGSAPGYFQDRTVETRFLVTQLKDENKRLFTVVGRGGVGKTAMVCRLLKGIEAGRLPDELGQELGELAIDGLVYLSQNGTRQISAANLFADLGKLLPAPEAQQMETLYRDVQLATEAKVKALLTHFARQRVVVLLDNLEDLIDPATRQLTNAELNELLLALLRAPVHGVQVLCTTRIAPQGLALVQPQLQTMLILDEGLDSPYAENILRAMDADGKLGLKTAPDALLNTARARTRGYPRALEALVAILSSDRATSLPELLGDQRAFLPDHVVETLVGEAYSRLDRTAQLVMQALAIYARPVTAAAIDYLLQPYLPAVDAAATLNRLVNMHFVRKESDRYYLHPVDRSYALDRVPEGAPGDGTEDGDAAPLPLTRYALWHRGADYFAQAQRPRTEWKQLTDLSAQLAEFDLRCAAQEHSTAADVLFDIDFDYLLLWGHARLLVELHERLLGKLNDPEQKSSSLGNLGVACAALGQVTRAIDYYQQALAIAQQIGDRRGESAALGNLGNAYMALGQVTHAIDYYQQALAIAQQIGNRQGEGACLDNLGNTYYALGQVTHAIDYYQQALAIAQQIGNRQGEGYALGNLGDTHRNLGQAEQAMKYYEQTLGIAKEMGDRFSASLAYSALAYVSLSQSELGQAIVLYKDAVHIADEIQNREAQSESSYGLALAQLLTGDLADAIQTITIARQHDYPTNNANVLALQGVIQLRLGQAALAQEAFDAAIAQANGLLAQTPQNYDALDTLGLAQAGLALWRAGQAQNPQAAIENSRTAYRAARAITRAPGIVQRTLRLFDALAVADVAGVLIEVRTAVTGVGDK